MVSLHAAGGGRRAARAETPRAPFRGAAVKRRWTHCDEYVASLVRSDVVGDAAAPLVTVTVRPRFTVRSARAGPRAVFPPARIGSDEDRAARRRSRRVAVVGLETRGDVSVVARLGVSARASRDLVLVRARRDRPRRGHARHGVGPSRGRGWRRGTASFRVLPRVPRRGVRVARNARGLFGGGFRARPARRGGFLFGAESRVLASSRNAEWNARTAKGGLRRLRISDPADLDVPGTEMSPRKTALRFPPRFRPLAQAIAFAADRASAAVKKASAAPRAAVRASRASAPSAGVSVVVDEDVHGCPRELATRASPVSTRGSAPQATPLETLREAEGSFALSAARLDLQTPETTARPTVFSAGAPGASALSARASAAFSGTSARGRRGSVSGADASGASRANGGSWCARSFSVDAAPMTIDLREAFGSSAPRAAARLAAPFAAGAPLREGSAPPVPAAAAAVGALRAAPRFQSVRIGRIDAVVSFAALPFLPAGVRSIGAVDRARVALRAFALPSDAAARGSIGRASFRRRETASTKARFVSFLPSRGCRATRRAALPSRVRVADCAPGGLQQAPGRPRASVGGARSRDARAGRVAAPGGAGPARFSLGRSRPPSRRGPRPSCGTRGGHVGDGGAVRGGEAAARRAAALEAHRGRRSRGR